MHSDHLIIGWFTYITAFTILSKISVVVNKILTVQCIETIQKKIKRKISYKTFWKNGNLIIKINISIEDYFASELIFMLLENMST